jgi:hypothetical protein
VGQGAVGGIRYNENCAAAMLWTGTAVVRTAYYRAWLSAVDVWGHPTVGVG